MIINEDKIKDIFPDDDISKGFLSGSCYWFSSIPGFETHDQDYAYLVKDEEWKYTNITIYEIPADVFIFHHDVRVDKNDFLKKCIEIASPEKGTRYLPFLMMMHKGIANYIGFEFSDVLPYIDTIKANMNVWFEKSPKHQYYLNILNYMVENNSFDLTPEQLNSVYQIYIEHHNESNTTKKETAYKTHFVSLNKTQETNQETIEE